MRAFEKQITLQILDTHWKEHLAQMEALRQGIGLRGYGGKNPKQEYKRESFNLFESLLNNIQMEVIKFLSLVRIRKEEEVDSIEKQRVAGAVRTEVRALDPQLPAANMASMNDVLYAAVAGPRFITLLLAVFAGVALALAAIGTYGVMAYSVAQRRQEIGIRMALGAEASSVLGMVLGQGLLVAAAGITIGIAGALALTRLMTSLLFNVSTTDPLAFLSAPLLLALVALTACYIPARRATRVDPAVVLKSD